MTLIILVAFASLGLAQEHLKMSTTTSTENSGLLKVLLPPFEQKFNVKVDVIAVGTGKALELGKNGDVDVVLVHARANEDKFVAEGYGVDRRDVMYNDFIILGPKDDPAKIKESKSAIEAFKKLSDAQVTFVSRGDKSGTDIKEKDIWKAAEIKPQGKWYQEAGQGMEQVLTMASEQKAYTLSDRGTYLALKGKLELEILYAGDKALYNPYGIIAVNPQKFAHANYKMAKQLIDWITGEEGQKIIREFGKDTVGEPLFYPLAIP